MSRNQSHRTMSLFIGMILISIIMSYYNVEAFGRNNIKDDYTGPKQLRQLLRQLQMDDDEESFLRKRVEAEGDCTGDIIQGYKWDGEQSMSMKGIDTTQRCMDNCDLKKACVGWTYDAKTKMCWGFSSILGVDKSTKDKSGSCIGGSIKTKCTEKKTGRYTGYGVTVLPQIDSPEDCMENCDKSNTCYGWLHSKDEQKCDLYDSIGEFESSKDDDGFISGSCIAPQKRVRLAEPLKLFRTESLERHNLQRAKHCSPALKLDDDLNKLSQDLAIKIAGDDVMPPVYEETGMQIVFYGKADAARSCSSIVDCFYDERKYYNWDEPDFSVTNFFPKVIWKNSAKMGVGRAFATDNQTMYVVMSYDGEGDLADSYKENVLKECKQ